MTLSELGNRASAAYGVNFSLRLMASIKPEGDCWVWLASVSSSSKRPTIWLNGGKVYVSRLVLRLKLARGLKRGMLAGHMCDNRLCVNPGHLEEVTCSKNLADAYKRLRRVPKPTTFEV